MTEAKRLLVFALVASMLATGCVSGALFTHVTEPIDINFNRTPVHSTEGTADWHSVQYYVQIDWGDNAFGEVAKQAGLSRIHYADLETLSILGVYTQRKVHVYGER